MNHEVNERQQELLVKCINGEATDSEYEEAYRWVEMNNESKRLFRSLYTLWFAVRMRRMVSPEAEQRVWEKLKGSGLNKKTGKPSIGNKFLYNLVRIAAIFVVAFLLGIFVKSYFSNHPSIITEKYTVEASKGAKSAVTLADGTHVLLNAGSRLWYTSHYNQREREVNLIGEAYFEVAKHRSKPFKVVAGGIVVRALGTAFNVKAYPDDKTVETTLVEGSVCINKAGREGSGNAVFLKPNQHAVYYKTDDELKTQELEAETDYLSAIVNNEQSPVTKGEIVLTPQVEPEVYTSWKDKRWIFHSETFGEFVKKLERLYDIDIILEDAELRNYKLTGSIEEENIEMVLKALQLIIPIDYQFEHNRLIIREDTNLKANFDQTLTKTNSH